ncbi:MAG: hypothetical protein JO060_05130 [Candidatus Eremiobacteraeota bacterium]|nr:hypothetical protein [Candidatus Eremiobacteraeota bacterium]MBV9647222.1 hypothetical protein [Candidatus Eremiobacteraeota bacterium]
MAKYLLAYKGTKAADVPASEREAVFAAWTKWMGDLGKTLIDRGDPFGDSATVSGNGASRDGASSNLTGYSIIEAQSLAAAAEAAKGCPVLSRGGTVEVYEAFEM